MRDCLLSTFLSQTEQQQLCITYLIATQDADSLYSLRNLCVQARNVQTKEIVAIKKMSYSGKGSQDVSSSHMI